MSFSTVPATNSTIEDDLSSIASVKFDGSIKIHQDGNRAFLEGEPSAIINCQQTLNTTEAYQNGLIDDVNQ